MLSSVIAWWLGPNLLHLTLLNDQRNQPFAVLSVARGLPQDVYAARYLTPLAGLATSEGALLMDGYQLSHQVAGRRDQTWQYLARLQFQQARDVAQVTTASPYRVLANLLSLQQQLFGSFTPIEQPWRAVVVVWLVQNFAATKAQPGDPLAPVLTLLPQGSGRLVWDAQLTPIAQNVHWQRMVVLDFPNEVEALTWLRHAEVRTARAITNARVQDLSLALFSRANETNGR